MSGYCDDCGNTLCICSEVEAQSKGVPGKDLAPTLDRRLESSALVHAHVGAQEAPTLEDALEATFDLFHKERIKSARLAKKLEKARATRNTLQEHLAIMYLYVQGGTSRESLFDMWRREKHARERQSVEYVDLRTQLSQAVGSEVNLGTELLASAVTALYRRTVTAEDRIRELEAELRAAKATIQGYAIDNGEEV